MNDESSASGVSPGDVQFATLAAEVAQLRDLFQRRSFEDKARNRLYDDLHAQLALARGGLTEQILAPLFRELLLVVDRVTRVNMDGDLVLESVAEELLELMERRDVHRVPRTGVFDPAIHEAVSTEPRDDHAPGTILEVLRPGYLLGGQLLRAERVVVAAAETGSDPAASEPAEEPAMAEPEDSASL
ncbi:MAG TPA: nucleotide exchange factor GrpE [Streptosporangiaceae bacterium]|nr:nucleotide exchange factor GrpE [Streptosporangiaceae bacterium]